MDALTGAPLGEVPDSSDSADIGAPSDSGGPADSNAAAGQGAFGDAGVQADAGAVAAPRLPAGIVPGRAAGYVAVAALSVALVFGVHASGPGSALPTASVAPSSIVAAAPSGPSASSAVPSPSVAPTSSAVPATAVPTSAPTATPTLEPSVVPLPSQTAPTATITFTGLMLDSTADTAAVARTFQFDSDGPGAVSAQIVATSPTETTKICISADGGTPECASGGTPGFVMPSTTPHSHWIVTVVSANEGTPTVDVAFRWPALHPSVRVDGGRFQGSPNPDSLRSLNATFRTRAAGAMTVEAAWRPATTPATVTLNYASETQPVELDLASYPAASSLPAAYTHPVAAGRTYTVTIYNTGSDAGRPNLAATIAFP